MGDKKPVLVWVPGSFCPPKIHYQHIFSLFTSRGYDLVPVDLLTTTKKPGPPPSMYDDAAHIHAVVSGLADEGRDVVIVAHSYGGTPVSESLKGLSKTDRQKNEKQGGVVRVGYIAALVPAVGSSGGSMIEGAGMPADYTAEDEDGWLSHVDPVASAKYCFDDEHLGEGSEWTKKFTQQTVQSFENKLTYAGYKDVRVSWFFTEKDEAVPPSSQQAGIDQVENTTGKTIDVKRVQSDHMPHVSAPELLVDWMVSLVEIGGRE